jgi:hypothetical protein
MKTRMMTILSMAVALNAAPALAGVADAAGNFHGAGTQLTPDGKALGDYQVDLAIRATGPHAAQIDVTVTLANGNTLRSTQQMIDGDGPSFTITSDGGKGGGACYGEGLCEMYIDLGGGHAYATTLVHDADGSQRQLRTELQDGKAVSIFREKYVRQN